MGGVQRRGCPSWAGRAESGGSSPPDAQSPDRVLARAARCCRDDQTALRAACRCACADSWAGAESGRRTAADGCYGYLSSSALAGLALAPKACRSAVAIPRSSAAAGRSRFAARRGSLAAHVLVPAGLDSLVAGRSLLLLAS